MSMIPTLIGAAVGAGAAWALGIAAQTAHNACYQKKQEAGMPDPSQSCNAEQPALSWFTGYRTGIPMEYMIGAFGVAGGAIGNALAK